jgi:hypothetical protein
MEKHFAGILNEVSESRAEDMRAMIRGEVSEAIANRKTSSELTTRMRDASEDWARDWKRIARTEMQLAHEEGHLEHVRRRGGDQAQMAKIPSKDACSSCLSLYLDADGRPAVHPISWWDAQGVNNVGRKQKDWKGCIGAVHPHCRCSITEVAVGWGFDDAWDLVPLEEPTEKSLDEGQLIKAGTFGGVVGLVQVDRPIGSMSTIGDPPKERADFAAHPIEGHYADPRRQRKKKRRLVLTRHAKDIQAVLPYQPGMVRDKPNVPDRGHPRIEENRRNFDQREADRDEGRAKLVLRPQDRH